MTPVARSAAVRACLDVIEAAFRASGDPALHRFAKDLAEVPRGPVGTLQKPRLDHPAMAILDETVPLAAEGGEVARACANVAPLLDWAPVFQDVSFGRGVSEGMMAAQLVGTYGVFASDRLAAGIFALAPGVVYPEHTHQSEEVYHCLAGALTLRHGLSAAPFDVTQDSYSITPPHRLHALRVAQAPTLLLYVWRGDLTAPMWIWEPAGTGWDRVEWRRKPGASWAIVRREPVDAAILSQATE